MTDLDEFGRVRASYNTSTVYNAIEYVFILFQAFGECQENNPARQGQAARRKSSGQVQTSGPRGWSPQAILALSQRSFGNPNSHDTGNSRQTDARNV